MTQDEILEMVREAGGSDVGGPGWTTWVGTQSTEFLERFAHLVAAKEREACGEAAMKAAEKAVDVAIKLEREACAKIAERFEPDEKTSYVTYASTAIRARGQA